MLSKIQSDPSPFNLNLPPPSAQGREFKKISKKEEEKRRRKKGRKKGKEKRERKRAKENEKRGKGVKGRKNYIK